MPTNVKRLAVLNLMRGRLGEWVTRKEIEEVGGWDAMRRLREVRHDAGRLDLVFEQRTDPATGILQYRVTARPEPTGPGLRWACRGCGRLVPQYETQPSVDPRWRVGPCPVCKERAAVYEPVPR